MRGGVCLGLSRVVGVRCLHCGIRVALMVLRCCGSVLLFGLGGAKFVFSVVGRVSVCGVVCVQVVGCGLVSVQRFSAG